MGESPQKSLVLYPSQNEEQRAYEKLDNFESILPSNAQGENSLYSNVSRTLGSTTCSFPETSSQDQKCFEMTSEAPSPSGSGSSRVRASSKVCEVCGDKAKSFHFGGVSCDSCKAFFRRAVQSDSYNSFRCPYDGCCNISVATRKTCQACRFKRCLHIGMEKKWVMNEYERNTFQKQRQEKKLKKSKSVDHRSYLPGANSSIVSPAGSFDPDIADMLKFMTPEEQSEIETLVLKIHQSYTDIPYQVSQSSQSRNSIEIIEMFTTILRRMVYFHKNLPDFSQLIQEDQSILLRQGVLEMCMLRSALTYDFKNNRWPIQTGNMEFLRNCPVLRVEDMKKLVSPDLYDMQMRFISGIQELHADEPIVALLTLIVLFSPDRTGLLNHKAVGLVQEKYLRHLKNYTLWRFGPHGSKMYPKFLTKLSDLRQLNDSHNEYNLRLAQREVNQIQEQLSSINLNPYTHWDVVKCDNEKAVGQVNPSTDAVHKSTSNSVNPNFSEGTQRSPVVSEKLQTFSMSQTTTSATVFRSSMAGILFSQMVNQQIPILIGEFEDPMTLLSTDQERPRGSKLLLPRGVSYSKIQPQASFVPPNTHSKAAPSFTNTNMPAFEQEVFVGESAETCSGIPPAYTVDYNQVTATQQSPKCLNSTLKNILECIGEISDTNFLQQVKQNLSPEVLERLQSTFTSEKEVSKTLKATHIPQSPLSSSDTATDPSISSINDLQPEKESGTEVDSKLSPKPIISDQISNILQSFGYNENEHVTGGPYSCSTVDTVNYLNPLRPNTLAQDVNSSYSGSGDVPASLFVEKNNTIADTEDQELQVSSKEALDIEDVVS